MHCRYKLRLPINLLHNSQVKRTVVDVITAHSASSTAEVAILPGTYAMPVTEQLLLMLHRSVSNLGIPQL